MRETIPYSLTQSLKIGIDWLNVVWAYDRAIIDWSFPVEMAICKIQSGSEKAWELDLASMTKSEAHLVGEILRKNCEEATITSIQQSKSKWLYLKLYWVYENRHSLLDPLEAVEKIYADFDYPKEIEGFVKYMPTTDGYSPDAHSSVENNQRLFQKWENYLLASLPTG